MARSASVGSASRAAGAGTTPQGASRSKIAAAAVVESCWPTIVRSIAANPSGRERQGGMPAVSSAARKRGSIRYSASSAVRSISSVGAAAPDGATPPPSPGREDGLGMDTPPYSPKTRSGGKPMPPLPRRRFLQAAAVSAAFGLGAALPAVVRAQPERQRAGGTRQITDAWGPAAAIYAAAMVADTEGFARDEGLDVRH